MFHGYHYAASWPTGFEALILKSYFIEGKYKQLQSCNEATEGLLESVQSEMMVMGELK